MTFQPNTFLFRFDLKIVDILTAADIDDLQVLVCCVQTVQEAPALLLCLDGRPIEVECCLTATVTLTRPH